MVHLSRSTLLNRALAFTCLVGLAAPASTWAQCPTLSPAGTFPGTTLFNNTVRAQMWIDLDNAWWGAFSDASSGIYLYRRQGGNFIKGDFIDGNFQSGKPDTLFNGLELFVVIFESGSLAKLYKYIPSVAVQGSLLTGLVVTPTYTLLPGFPVDLPLAGLANAIALDQDGTGKLWATYTSGHDVHVIWSTSVDHTAWDTTGVILAPDIADVTTEAATLARFGGDKIGVVWGNQRVNEIAFRFHNDLDPEASWSDKEVVDCCELDADPIRVGRLKGVADDHLSLRAAPDGRLFLIAKDGIGSGRLHLYVRDGFGTWGQKTIVDDDPDAEPTRPVLVLDTENSHAYVVYRESVTSAIYFTRTPMDSPGFEPRCLFAERPTGGPGQVKPGRAENPTSTKQNLNGTTDLVAVASTAGGTPPVPLLISAKVVDLAGGPIPLPALPTSVAAPTSLFAGGTPIPDFATVWDGALSISSTPLVNSQWTWLRARDAQTIVNLNDGMPDVARFGFESFLWVRFAPGGTPTNEDAGDFLDFIQVHDNQPVHISSERSDRKALMVALARYAIDGWSLQNALAEAQRLNQGIPLSLAQVLWLQGWAATHLPGSYRLG
jgi:hypothetical protein